MSAIAVGAAPLTAVAEIAFRDGLAAALKAAWGPRDSLLCSINGLTLVPTGDADRVRDGQLDRRFTGGSQDEATIVKVLPHRLTALEGLDFVQVAGASSVIGAVDPARSISERSQMLIAIRIGLTQRMLVMGIEHLRGRLSDGLPLTSRQLVQAGIADATTAIEICRHAMTVAATAGADGRPPTEWIHDRLDRADATIIAMFGAAGYLLDHPIRCLHVVALLRDLWTDPFGRGDDPR